MTEYLFLAAAILKPYESINKIRSGKRSERRSMKIKKRKEKSRERMAESLLHSATPDRGQVARSGIYRPGRIR